MAVVGVTLCVPDVAFVPLQPFDAVHEVALVEFHVRVEDWPDVMEEGETERETIGAERGGGGGSGDGDGENEDGDEDEEVTLGCAPISPCISDSVSARLYIRTSSMVPRKQPLPELAEVPILGLFHWASLSFCDVGMLVVLLLSSTPFMYILMAAPGSYVPTR